MAPNEQEQQLPPLPDASALPKVHKEWLWDHAWVETGLPVEWVWIACHWRCHPEEELCHGILSFAFPRMIWSL